MKELWKNFTCNGKTIEVSNMGNFKTPKFSDGTYKGCVSKCSNGKIYRVIGFKSKGIQKNLLAHRIVMNVFNDVDINDHRDIDHIDGNSENNRIDNLRIVSRFDNNMNSKCHINGQMPFIRIGRLNRNLEKPYMLQIVIEGKTKSFGYYKSRNECVQKGNEICNDMKENGYKIKSKMGYTKTQEI